MKVEGKKDLSGNVFQQRLADGIMGFLTSWLL